MKMDLPSSLILSYVIGLRWMCMHLWINLIKRTIDIHEKLNIVEIYVQSQWRVVLLWYHIFWQSSIQRGRNTQLCIITSLKRIIQICSNFYWWVCKIAFCSRNPCTLLFGETSPLTWRKWAGSIIVRKLQTVTIVVVREEEAGRRSIQSRQSGAFGLAP